MKKLTAGILICILLIGIFFIGKHFSFIESAASSEEVTTTEEAAERNLRISFTTNIDESFNIPLEHDNYRDVTCLGIENVTINIDGIVIQLKDALQEGHVSVDEMIAYARQDANLGLCKEVAESKNGLTEFTYYYQEFRLHYVYDLYETPDGKQHLITDFLIYGIGREPHFLPRNEETGKRIDSEDWGVRFDVVESDPDHINVKCSQSGGQQIGKLYAEEYILYRKNPDTLELEPVHPMTEEGDLTPFIGYENWEPEADHILTMGGTTEMSFIFSHLYGQLYAGDYIIDLKIVDRYNEEDLHPLMRNFYDAQWYQIEFTIE